MKETVNLSLAPYETIRLETSEYDNAIPMLYDLLFQLEMWEEYSSMAVKMIQTIKKRLEVLEK